MPLKSSDLAEEPTINLTPMVDIVFNLIIFFMLGTQLATERDRHYDVQLPTVSDAQPLTSLPDELIINVLRDGTVIVEGQVTSVPQLEKRLRAAQRNYADQGVIVRGDASGRYQGVMDVLAACHRAKITHLSLANRLEGAER